MHCHLRLPVAPVVLGFNYEAHNAPAYDSTIQQATFEVP